MKVRPVSIRCSECGELRPVARSGSIPIYCSSRCARAAVKAKGRPTSINCGECGTPVEVRQAGRIPATCKPCSAAIRLARIRTRRIDVETENIDALIAAVRLMVEAYRAGEFDVAAGCIRRVAEAFSEPTRAN